MSAPTFPICLPTAPLNGGPLETAPPKVGQWVWQPKIDDWRGIVHTPSMTVWNQEGRLSSVSERGKIGISLALLCGPLAPTWLDIGIMQNRHDMMRGSIIVLDMVPATPLLFGQRRAVLEKLFTVMPDATEMVGRPDLAHNRVYLIPQVGGEAAGRLLYAELKQQNATLGRKFYEGVVCKKVTSIYPLAHKPKMQTPDWIKHRFDQ